jgi:hypothetical protein
MVVWFFELPQLPWKNRIGLFGLKMQLVAKSRRLGTFARVHEAQSLAGLRLLTGKTGLFIDLPLRYRKDRMLDRFSGRGRAAVHE